LCYRSIHFNHQETLNDYSSFGELKKRPETTVLYSQRHYNSNALLPALAKASDGAQLHGCYAIEEKETSDRAAQNFCSLQVLLGKKLADSIHIHTIEPPHTAKEIKLFKTMDTSSIS
jgi:hypothetical protein